MADEARRRAAAMKIGAGRADAFVAAPDARVGAVLIYGPDTGLVRERASALVRAVAGDAGDPFRVSELSAAMVRDDPARLSSEAAALSMTGGRRAVSVSDASDALTPAFERLLGGGPWEAMVVAAAGELASRSSLRRLFEGAKKAAAALPCYLDDGATLGDVIQTALGGHGITVSREAFVYLSSHLGADRLVTRSELEKLAVFVGAGGDVDLETAELMVGDSAGRTLEDVVFAAAGGDRATLDSALVQSGHEGVSPVAVLRAAARHFERLLRATDMVAAGASVEGAMKALRPPVFFKRAEGFGHQMRRWSRPRIVDALARLVETELRCKTTGAPAASLCARVLFGIAQVGARRGR